MTFGGHVLTFVYPDEAGLQLEDIVDVGAEAISTAGLFGFCFSKRLLRVRFWKVCVPPLLCWDLHRFAVEVPYDLMVREPFDTETVVVCIVFGALLLLLVPAYIALYRYAYDSDGLWHDPEEPVRRML